MFHRAGASPSFPDIFKKVSVSAKLIGHKMLRCVGLRFNPPWVIIIILLHVQFGFLGVLQNKAANAFTLGLNAASPSLRPEENSP